MAKKEILFVAILEAKPNKMFTEDQRNTVRFLHYNRTVACAECGKKRKVMWTMICEFYAHSMGPGPLLMAKGKIHQPLTAVCGDHPLGPAWPRTEQEDVERKRNEP